MSKQRLVFRPEHFSIRLRSITDIQAAIREFYAVDDLTSATDAELRRLSTALRRLNYNLGHHHAQHAQRNPSVIWMLLSVISGFGGIPLTELSPIGIVITAAGTLGAGKSLYDHSAHLAEEQRLLALLWLLEDCIQRLKTEVIRRGMPLPSTSP